MKPYACTLSSSLFTFCSQLFSKKKLWSHFISYFLNTVVEENLYKKEQISEMRSSFFKYLLMFPHLNHLSLSTFCLICNWSLISAIPTQNIFLINNLHLWITVALLGKKWEADDKENFLLCSSSVNFFTFSTINLYLNCMCCSEVSLILVDENIHSNFTS